MMGRRGVGQAQFFYSFDLDEVVPAVSSIVGEWVLGVLQVGIMSFEAPPGKRSYT
jgi:hypothetical protein